LSANIDYLYHDKISFVHAGLLGKHLQGIARAAVLFTRSVPGTGFLCGVWQTGMTVLHSTDGTAPG
jgi:hypothetical protein